MAISQARDKLEPSHLGVGALFANPALRGIVAGWSIGIAADQAFLIATLVAAFGAGGIVAVAVLGVVRTMPATATTLLTSVGSARQPERVLVLSNIARSISAVSAGVLVMVAPRELTEATVLLCAAIVAGSGSLVRPTQAALLPAFATSPEQLVAANVGLTTGEGLGTVIGPLGAAVLLAVAGPGVTFVAAGIAFGIAALASRVQVAEAARSARPRNAAPPLVAGIRALRRLPGPAILVAAFQAQVLVRGLLVTLLVLVSTEVLRTGDAGIGVLGGAIGVGGVVAGALALVLTARERLARVVAIALVAWGLPIAAIGAAPSLPLALIALAVVGAGNALLDVAGFTLMQRTIPSASRMAVFGLFEGLVGLFVAIGAALAPILVSVAGTRGALVVTGAILPIMAAVTWPRVRRLDDEWVVPRSRGRLLQSMTLFRLLPLAGIERLAAGAVPARFEAGDALMREGEPGDRYLVLASGGADVSQRGRLLRHVGPGDGVGEIALLRRLPRTATVVATEPVDALAIDEGTFVAAVTGHEASGDVAEAQVEQRLAIS